MKEVVDRILQEEELARKRIEKADSDGKLMVSRAGEEARRIVKEALTQADLASQAKKEQAAKAFALEKEKALKQASEQISGRIESKSKDIPAIAGKFFAGIIENNK